MQPYVQHFQHRLFRLTKQENVTFLVFCAGMAAATILALLVSSYDIGFPLSEWLFRPKLIFSDWTDLYHLARYLPNPALPQLFSPPVDLLGRVASHHMSQQASGIFLYFLPILAGLTALWLLTRTAATGFLIVFSYPFFFAVVRGNMEIHVFLLVFLALISLIRKDITSFFVLIFFASLVKPFALGFLAIMALDRPRQTAGVILASVATNLGALYLLGHSNFDALQAYFGTARNYGQLMAVGGVGDLYNNSLYTFGKIIAGISNRRILYLSGSVSLLIVGASYFQACRAIGALPQFGTDAVKTALAYGTIFYLPLFIGLCISVSADYRLIYFIISVFFLVSTGDYFFSPKTRHVLLAVYFLILVPKHFVEFGPLEGILRFKPFPPTADITLQSIVNPILMLTLCVILGTSIRLKETNAKSLAASV